MKPAISSLSLFWALTICICNTTSAVHKTLASKTLLWLQSCLLVQFVWESLRYFEKFIWWKLGWEKVLFNPKAGKLFVCKACFCHILHPSSVKSYNWVLLALLNAEQFLKIALLWRLSSSDHWTLFLWKSCS